MNNHWWVHHRSSGLLYAVLPRVHCRAPERSCSLRYKHRSFHHRQMIYDKRDYQTQTRCRWRVNSGYRAYRNLQRDRLHLSGVHLVR
jgi:hypothetical protein